LDFSILKEIQDVPFCHVGVEVQLNGQGLDCGAELTIIAGRQRAKIGLVERWRIVFLFQEQRIVSFKFDVLDYNTVIALEPGIVGQNGFIYRADLTSVRFEVVLFAVLLSFPWFFPLFLRRIWAGGFLVGLNLWLSLFALETIDLISQLLVLSFKFQVFLAKGLDEVEQFADHLKGLLEVRKVVDLKIV
jgi:hypothetical protein